MTEPRPSVRRPGGVGMRLPALLLAVAGVAGGASGPAWAANADTVRPFRADYALEWRGIKAANAQLELVQTAPRRFTYVSRNQARGVFRMAFPDQVTQSSELSIEDSRVRPLAFRTEDGSSATARDVRLQFDWTRGRVTGVAEERPVDLALEPGVQDAMSVQIALMVALAHGETPERFFMIDKDEIKEYVYAREGRARLETPLGAVDTEIWSSRRPGSNRVIRAWYAPALGWVPVQAERRRKDAVEFTMRIRTLTR